MFSAPVSPSRLAAPVRSPSSVAAFSTVFRRATLAVGCLAALFVPSLVQAQTPGELDTSFVAVFMGATPFALTLENINGTTRIFAGGDLAAYVRMLTDGTEDTTFAFQPVFGNESGRIIYTAVQELVIESGSAPKLLVGGLFGRSADQISANQPAQNIFRVNLDGTVDTTFNPGKGSDNFITAILPLPDGGMVVGGEFLSFNNMDHERIVRLDRTGAIVPTGEFDSALAFDSTVLSLAAQVNPDAAGPQGQILVAGVFINVDGQDHHGLARINADGSVDTSFSPIFDDRVVAVTCQPDGKILVGGYFQNVNGTAAKHIVRLNYDGSVDTSFTTKVTEMPPLTSAPVAVNVITPVGDGRYYIGGNFAKINGVTRNYLGRVLADGSIDDFDPGTVITNTVQQVAVDPFTNLVYVSETRSKSTTSSTTFPPSLIRLFGDPVSTPDVIVTAPISNAVKGSNGEFLFTRVAQDLRQSLTFYVTLGGTATLRPHNKFKLKPALTGTAEIDGEPTFVITFPVNAATETVGVHVPQASKGKARTVTLTVQPSPTDPTAYTSGSTSTVTVTP